MAIGIVCAAAGRLRARASTLIVLPIEPPLDFGLRQAGSLGNGADAPVPEAGLPFEFNDGPWDARSGGEHPASVPPFSGASHLEASPGAAEASRGAADEAPASRAKSLTLLGLEPCWDAWDAFCRYSWAPR
jgi:hypothetical protein